MSDDLFVFTETLPLSDAKKLLAALQKPGKKGAWQDWSGKGGFETEVKLSGLTGRQVGELQLPIFCSRLMLETSDWIQPRNNLLPEFLFLGGDEWTLPEYGDSNKIQLIVFIKELNYPVWVSYQNECSMQFMRSYNICRIMEVYTGASRFTHVPIQINSEEPSAEQFDAYMNKLWRRYDIPNRLSPQCLEFYDNGTLRWGGHFSPTETDWFVTNFRKMIQDLIVESPAESYLVRAFADLGLMSKFHGKVVNVTNDAQGLLKCVAQRNSYDSYDVTYSVVGPQNWRGREKSRKKWKRPINQDLGVLTLEDGTTATVSLRIEKEGYVFTLEFEDIDGLAAFRETKLFQKTHWNLGAE